jgi:hypothetical protein
MITRDRRLLEQLIKQWAQEQNTDWVVADYNNTEDALVNTQNAFNWVIRETTTTVDLVSLVDKIEVWMESRRKRSLSDGMFCQKCGLFYQFAEPNQDDGSLVCYACRSNPYR